MDSAVFVEALAFGAYRAVSYRLIGGELKASSFLGNLGRETRGPRFRGLFTV